jgi:acyl carrier protein
MAWFVVAHRTRAEMKLASIWAVSLGLPLVGVRDNFFELGGTSLLAATLLVQVERSFGKNFPLASLFIAPTVDKLGS